jgi:hypothetical protein
MQVQVNVLHHLFRASLRQLCPPEAVSSADSSDPVVARIQRFCVLAVAFEEMSREWLLAAQATASGASQQRRRTFVLCERPCASSYVHGAVCTHVHVCFSATSDFPLPTTGSPCLSATELGQEVLGWVTIVRRGSLDGLTGLADGPSFALLAPRLSCAAFLCAFDSDGSFFRLTSRALASPTLLRKLGHLMLDPLLLSPFTVEVTFVLC